MGKALAVILCLLFAGCGDKLPESKAAKEVGNIPRQAIDGATTGVDAAIQQGADRGKEEDKK